MPCTNRSSNIRKCPDQALGRVRSRASPHQLLKIRIRNVLQPREKIHAQVCRNLKVEKIPIFIGVFKGYRRSPLLALKFQCHAPAWRYRGSAVPQSQPSLPTNRAFVVQFRAQPAGPSPCYEGRVEHVVSGQVARFHSLEELLAFMTRMLTDVEEQADSP
jgi:hypothetical protein